MKSRPTRILLSAIAIVFALGVVPVYADDAAASTRGAVPNDCTAFGTPLLGMSEADARAAIASAAVLPDFSHLTFTANGKTYFFRPQVALAVDVDAMLDAAYEPTETAGFAIAPVYSVKTQTITSWIARVVSASEKPAVDARYYLKSGKVAVYRGAVGRRVHRFHAANLVRSMVESVAASAEVTSAPVAMPTYSFRPRITVGNMGKVLIVDVSERRLRLYKNGRLEKKFRVAVGTPGHPTPKGTWKIVRKVKWPTWTNPAPNGWGANMPAYIGPGPSNPLGTRALYLNASGIRIHGTSKRSSIGTAASHGCMRMLREDIEELYPLVPVGITVYIVK